MLKNPHLTGKTPIKFRALSYPNKGGFVNIKITAMTFGDGQVSSETRWVTETVIRDETDRGFHGSR